MSLSFNDSDYLPIYKADSAGSWTYPFDHPNHCFNYPKIWTAWFYCTVMCPKGNQSVNAEWRSECPLFAQFARLLSIIISNFSFAGTMMSVLSQKASPSQKYTNHSLRTTSVPILDATQIPTRYIMSVTGHKAETSLKTYTGHTNNKKNMSNIITKSIGAVSDINNSSEQLNVLIRTFQISLWSQWQTVNMMT